MTRFILSRLVMLVPVLLGIIIVTFTIVRLIPGDPCRYRDNMPEDVVQRCRQHFGLDQPLTVQFVKYLQILGTGDLGDSFKLGQPVSEVIVQRLPFTVELTLSAMLFASFAGLALGLAAAVRHNSAVDVGTMAIANTGISMPVYWLGLMLIWLFAVGVKGTAFQFLQLPPGNRLSPGLSVKPLADTLGLHWTGLAGTLLTFVSNMYLVNSLISGRLDIFMDAVRHLILPALAVGTIPLALIARITRSSMLEVLGADYIRTARAKGLAEQAVVMRHGLRNALLPIVTVIGLQAGSLLSGAVLTETTFGLPGLGKQLVDSIIARDYWVVQGAVIVIALIYVVVNMLVDVSYAYLDPRIRLQ